MIGSGVRILLVEDNPKDAKLTMHALRHELLANTIEVAQDGEEALDFLFCRGRYSGRVFDEQPHLVLLDLKLPKIGGMEVLRQLKSDLRTRAIPVVVLTASREEKDLVESYRLGVNAYIQKPVEFDSFRQAIRQVGLFWLVINQPPPRLAFRAEGSDAA